MQFRSHELMTMRDAYPTSSGLGSDNVSHMIHGEIPSVCIVHNTNTNGAVAADSRVRLWWS